MAKLTIPKSEIKIEKPISDFLEHLTSNNRILFSGKFGIGKTFFLKEFFQISEIKEKYNVFHLFPVNYQIATNEDIFELIKYDILYHLFGFDWIKIDVENFPKLLVAQSYLINNGISVFSKILKCIPLFGIDKAERAIETLLNIQKDFLRYYNEINQNDVTLLDNFREQIEKKKGSLYEFDIISEFIYENLSNCNSDIEEGKHRENVLIIDDLDRIDPDHIFRLLNVFSAHIDKGDGSNKFGFDKIIFVCDINNIRNIFAAKYGQQTDFSGYIDKFYSSHIFYFDNKTAISDFVSKIMANNLDKSRSKQSNFYTSEIECIKDIMYLFVEGNVINLRQIFSNVEKLKDKNQSTGIINRNNYFPGYTIIQTCLKILGEQKDVMINAFKKVALPSDRVFRSFSTIASYLLPLLIDNIYSSDPDAAQLHSIQVGGVDISFYIISHQSDIDYIYAEFVDKHTIVSYNLLQAIIIEVLNILDKKGLLN